MKFPSLNYVLENVRNTVKRFPLPFLASFMFVLFFSFILHDVMEEDNTISLLLTFMFAFPVFLAFDIFLESKKYTSVANSLVRVLGIGIVFACYFFLCRDAQYWGGGDVARYALIGITSLFLVAFAPFFTKDKCRAFWEYIMDLIHRLAMGIGMFTILFLGIMFLLLGVDYMFDVRIDEEFYFDIWAISLVLFNSIYFLSGIPKNVASLDKVREYPKHLNILVKYFLMPITALYLILLYVYTGKAALTWHWPEGGVAWWVLAFTFASVGTYFLSYFYKDDDESYVEPYKKWVFVAMLPLIIVLFLSIGIRIADYGLTVPRYLIVAYGIWLLVMCFYFIFYEKKNLKTLVSSLVVVLLFVNFMPVLNGFYLSEKSQFNRLEAFLIMDDVLVDGKINLNAADGNDIVHIDEIRSIVRYIVDTHGVDGFSKWIDVDEYEKNTWRYDLRSNVIRDLGLEGVYSDYGKGGNYAYSIDYKTFDVSYKEWVCLDAKSCFIDVSEYDYFMQINLYRNNEFSLWDDGYSVFLDDEFMSFYKDGELIHEINILDLFDDGAEIVLTPEEAEFEFELDDYTVFFRIDYIRTKVDSNEVLGIESLKGFMFSKKK